MPSKKHPKKKKPKKSRKPKKTIQPQNIPISNHVKTTRVTESVRRDSPVTTMTGTSKSNKMVKTVFVTGATGFVGNAVVAELLRQEYTVIALVRRGNEQKLPFRHERLIFRSGDVLDYESLLAAAKGADAIIHLVGIIEETKTTTFQKMHVDATRKVIDAAKELGIQRFIHMSALGTRPHAKSKYHQTKYQAEEIVRASGLNYTIFRPSLIFGPGDKSVNLFVSILKKQPGAAVFPIMGKGTLQPITVEDVALGVVNSLQIHESINHIYNVGGPHKFTMQELIKTIGTALGKPVATPHIPYALSRSMLAIAGPLVPITIEQLKMLQEDNTCDSTVFCKTFNVRLREFLPRLKEYLV